MSKTVVVIPDQHAHPSYNNDRALWLGKMIKDLKPDAVVNIGDGADMPSLSAYDKGKASFHGNNYEKDIVAHLDFQEKLWHPTKKAKKKQPSKFYTVGNHEQRISKVLEYEPQLSGNKYGISLSNLELEKYYNEVYYYNGSTPGFFTYEGITFAHYLVSGLMGRAISGQHHASSLLNKCHRSCVVGHSHTVDYSVHSRPDGSKIMGLVCGVYQDYESGWAGSAQNHWWRGVVVLRNVQDGCFDPEFVSIDQLRKAYSE